MKPCWLFHHENHSLSQLNKREIKGNLFDKLYIVIALRYWPDYKKTSANKGVCILLMNCICR